MMVRPTRMIALATVMGSLLLMVALTQAGPVQDLLQDLMEYDYKEEDFDTAVEEKTRSGLCLPLCRREGAIRIDRTSCSHFFKCILLQEQLVLIRCSCPLENPVFNRFSHRCGLKGRCRVTCSNHAHIFANWTQIWYRGYDCQVSDLYHITSTTSTTTPVTAATDTLFPTALPAATTTTTTQTPATLPSTVTIHCPTTKPATITTHRPTTKPATITTQTPVTLPATITTHRPTTKPATITTQTPVTLPATITTETPGTLPATITTHRPTTKPATITTQTPVTLPATITTETPVTLPATITTHRPTTKPATITTQTPVTLPATITTHRPTTKPATITTHRPTTKPATITTETPGILPATITTHRPTTKPATITTHTPTTKPATITTQTAVTLPATITTHTPTTKPATITTQTPVTLPATITTQTPVTLPATITTHRPTTKPATITIETPGTLPATITIETPGTLPATITTHRPTTKPATITTQTLVTLPATITTHRPTTKPATITTETPVTLPATITTHRPTTKPATITTETPVTLPATITTHRPTTKPATITTQTPVTLPATITTHRPTTKPATITTQTPVTLPATITTETPVTSPATITTHGPTTKPATITTQTPVTLPATITTHRPTTKPATITTQTPVTLPATITTETPVTLPATITTHGPTTKPATITTQTPVTLPATITTHRPTTKPATVTTETPVTLPATITTHGPTTKPATITTQTPVTLPATITTHGPTTKPATITTHTPTTKPATITTETIGTLPATITTHRPTTKPATITTETPVTLPATITTHRPTTKPATITTTHSAVILTPSVTSSLSSTPVGNITTPTMHATVTSPSPSTASPSVIIPVSTITPFPVSSPLATIPATVTQSSIPTSATITQSPLTIAATNTTFSPQPTIPWMAPSDCNNIQCLSANSRLQHPYNCSRYYKCVQSEGRLVALSYICPEVMPIFSPNLQMCVAGIKCRTLCTESTHTDSSDATAFSEIEAMTSLGTTDEVTTFPMTSTEVITTSETSWGDLTASEVNMGITSPETSATVTVPETTIGTSSESTTAVTLTSDASSLPNVTTDDTSPPDTASSVTTNAGDGVTIGMSTVVTSEPSAGTTASEPAAGTTSSEPSAGTTTSEPAAGTTIFPEAPVDPATSWEIDAGEPASEISTDQTEVPDGTHVSTFLGATTGSPTSGSMMEGQVTCQVSCTERGMKVADPRDCQSFFLCGFTEDLFPIPTLIKCPRKRPTFSAAAGKCVKKAPCVAKCPSTATILVTPLQNTSAFPPSNLSTDPTVPDANVTTASTAASINTQPTHSDSITPRPISITSSPDTHLTQPSIIFTNTSIPTGTLVITQSNEGGTTSSESITEAPSSNCQPVCLVPDSWLADPSDCRYFYVCYFINDVIARPRRIQCPHERPIFSQDLGRCVAEGSCLASCTPGTPGDNGPPPVTTISPQCLPQCIQPNSRVSDPSDCHHYYICILLDGVIPQPVRAKCPRSRPYFDTRSRVCVAEATCITTCSQDTSVASTAVPPADPCLPACIRPQTLVHDPLDCHHYYICSDINDSLTSPTRMKCPSHQAVFDHYTSSCSKNARCVVTCPSNTTSTANTPASTGTTASSTSAVEEPQRPGLCQPKCTSHNTVMHDPLDCRHYYVCMILNQEMHLTRIQCPRDRPIFHLSSYSCQRDVPCITTCEDTIILPPPNIAGTSLTTPGTNPITAPTSPNTAENSLTTAGTISTTVSTSSTTEGTSLATAGSNPTTGPTSLTTAITSPITLDINHATAGTSSATASISPTIPETSSTTPGTNPSIAGTSPSTTITDSSPTTKGTSPVTTEASLTTAGTIPTTTTTSSRPTTADPNTDTESTSLTTADLIPTTVGPEGSVGLMCHPECPRAGILLPDLTNCRRYYVCVYVVSLAPTPVRATCPRLRPMFDSHRQRCVADAQCYQPCAPQLTPAPNTSVTAGELCSPVCHTPKAVIPDPTNCRFYYTCLPLHDGLSPVRGQCPAERPVFDRNTLQCSKQAACIAPCQVSSSPPPLTDPSTSAGDGQACSEIGYFARSEACISTFTHCYQANGRMMRVSKTCPEGLVFNPIDKHPYCLSPSNCPYNPDILGPPLNATTCLHPGSFPKCHHCCPDFIHCQPSASGVGYYPVATRCSGDLVFNTNPRYPVCVRPGQCPSGQAPAVKCETEGNYAACRNCCKHYYHCTRDGRILSRTCPASLVFNPLPSYPYCVLPTNCPYIVPDGPVSLP
ncbi:uncharacterized protein [Panulirus ornatus]|uniref:uncharacterized protein n=1 Tax=Panulirus ornatus TaxID=150431 RepID=UPI003A8A3EA8